MFNHTSSRMFNQHSNSRSNRWHRSAGVALTIAMLLLMMRSNLALAHPLGNFTVNRYSRLTISHEQILLTYVVDMAEIPTQQERPAIDADGNGLFSDAEQAAYLAQLLPTLQENLALTLDGQMVGWQSVGHVLSFLEGQAGLPTMRLEAEFMAENESGNEIWQASFQDANFSERLGWQEVVVEAGEGISLLESTVPAVDVSEALTNYPTDLMQSPPSVNQADFRFEVGEPGAVNETSPSVTPSLSPKTGSLGTGVSLVRNDPFADLIKVPDLGPWTLFLALVAAFGWGAAHALSPGHGKTIVGAYLVGSRGTAKHALFLGLTTTVTHTAGVFALGLITLFASRYILPETLFPWLSLASGLLVVVIGLSMAWNWLGSWLKQGQHHHEHHHEHHHSHEHPQANENSHDDDHHRHTNELHQGLHTHDGVHYHTHEMPGQDGAPVTWRTLLTLGISGGLLPCPSALVVMLGAIALQRVAFGLLLIIVFSLGLAGVLTAFGLALVYAGKFFSRLPAGGWVVKLLPVASALFITAVGVGITWRAMIGM